MGFFSDYHFDLNFQFFLSIPIYLILLIGTFSNVLLLVLFIKDPLNCFRSCSTCFIVQLAVADFLVCLTTMFTLNCSKNFFVIELSITVPTGISITTIISISIDRFLMIAYPLRHRSLMGKKVMAFWLLVTWFMSLVFPIKLALFGKTKDDERSQKILALLVTSFTATMYILTYYKLKMQSKNVALFDSMSSQTRANQKRLLKEKKFLGTIILIASITLICLSPGLILGAIDPSQSFWQKLERKTILIVLSAFKGLYSFNFSINPFVYFIRMPNYRKSLKLLF